MGGYRTLVDGTTVQEREKSQEMTIDSRCPGKWLFVDLETGDIWEWRENTFKRAHPDKVKTLARVVEVESDLI